MRTTRGSTTRRIACSALRVGRWQYAYPTLPGTKSERRLGVAELQEGCERGVEDLPSAFRLALVGHAFHPVPFSASAPYSVQAARRDEETTSFTPVSRSATSQSRAACEDIANRAHLSRSLIYRKFRNKDEILAAVFQRLFEGRYERASEIIASRANKREKLLTTSAWGNNVRASGIMISLLKVAIFNPLTLGP
jgi:hypothetical protein